MVTEHDPDLATALDGLGGAPARPGVVHIVGGRPRDAGAGQGDPGGLTVRAAVLLASADHVLLDDRAADDVLRLARPDATVEVRSRDALASSLPDGSVVIVLPDAPTQIGGAEVARAVRDAGREVELVAGVPLAHVALAAAGVDVPTGPPGAGAPVVVPAPDAVAVARVLVGEGWLPETAVLRLDHPGTTRQTTGRTSLGELASDGPGGPAVLVVGTDLDVPWRGELPLGGVTVLVPRARAQASALSMRIRSLGGEAIEAPTITIQPGDERSLVAALQELADGGFTAVCLTSPNGVDAVADALDEAGLDARAFARVTTVACVGPGTAARLRQRLHVVADLLPERSTTASLAAAFPEGAGRVLLPRADIATNALAEGLRTAGYEPVEVAAYVTGTPDGLPGDVLARLADGGVDLVAFASSSTARNFATLVGDAPWRADVVSIGPVTSATCRELGLRVAVEADPHDLDGLVAALCRAAARRR